MNSVVVGILIFFTLLTGAYYIYLKYMNVSEKLVLRSFQLAGFTIGVQLILSLVLSLFGISGISSFFTAIVMGFVFTKVLNATPKNAYVSAFIIVVLSQVIILGLGSLVLKNT
jgi:hypothetical protein